MATPRSDAHTAKPSTSVTTRSRAKSRRISLWIPLGLAVAMLACIALVWAFRGGTDVSLNVGWALISSATLLVLSVVVHVRAPTPPRAMRNLVLRLVGLLAGGYFLWAIPASLYSAYECSALGTFNVADLEYCDTTSGHPIGLLVGALFIGVHASIWFARRRAD